MLNEVQREQVASEARHWVRLARACNNRCAFCLDTDAQDGTLVPAEQVRAEIEAGRAAGATRLILSGGEATIHKDFAALVRHGKAVGYRHVQTITNGRMFVYPRFVAAAVAAGLDEVTFSLHGHDAALHDGLTGVAGSYDQTTAGIRNAVASGRLIVSGDVVINRRNVTHLTDVVERFVDLGVREIDLLLVVPFGRATPGEEGDAGDDDDDAAMVFDPETALPHLAAALDRAEALGVQLWTNRLPPALLEGREHLIQDPHKLHDEVHGRRDLWDDLRAGRPMRCAGVRCAHCFIRPLCDAAASAARAIADGVPDMLRADLRAGRLPDVRRALLARPRRVTWLRASCVDQLEGVTGLAAAGQLWLELDDLTGLGPAHPAWPRRLLLTGGETLERALSLAPPELAVPVMRDTTGRLAGLRAPAGTSLLLAYRPAATLEQAAARDADLPDALAGNGADGFVELPPCWTGAPAPVHLDPVPLEAVADDGLLDVEAFVEHFIQFGYRVRSLRCRACRHAAACRGIPIQQARHLGLSTLRPVDPA